jgi:lipooligosaccharide transport system ATP-binding protein
VAHGEHLNSAAGDVLVSARGLRKEFDDFVAVDGIDFEVQRGEVFGFLGPNGAGKTSTMRMIGCTSRPSAGTLTVFGDDVVTSGPDIRARLGVVAQEDNLDTELSVWDNFIVYGRYFGLPRKLIETRAAELLDFAQLSDRKHDRVDPLSGGMKRRLTIARALINQPELVLLDEPTTGLDPQARHLLWDRLYGLKRAGVTLLLTTHYMDEAEQLCDRLVVMDNGAIVDTGSPRELIDRHVPREVVELRFQDPARQLLAAEAATGVAVRHELVADRLLLYADDGHAVRAHLHDRGFDGQNALIRRSSLEDVFLVLTGRTLVE